VTTTGLLLAAVSGRMVASAFNGAEQIFFVSPSPVRHHLSQIDY
jgi:hypothetical protein